MGLLLEQGESLVFRQSAEGVDLTCFTHSGDRSLDRNLVSWDSSARDSRVLTNAARSEKFSWAERVRLDFQFSYLVRVVAKCLLEGPFFLGGSIRISVVALNAALEWRGA